MIITEEWTSRYQRSGKYEYEANLINDHSGGPGTSTATDVPGMVHS